MATALEPHPRHSSSLSEPRRGDRKSECSFCSERFSSEEMKDHLLRCGNKTEQCPNCHKFIRRAIFAYHYENQCQDLPDDKTTTERKEDSSAFVICPFCSQRCPKKDQQTHQENCLSKPRQRPNEIVRIPCEYCEEQVDLNQWAIHTAECRDKDARRLEKRAREITREPMTEEIPCEYCQQTFPSTDLNRHQICCEENPTYRRARRRKTAAIEDKPLDRDPPRSTRDPPLSTIPRRADRPSLVQPPSNGYFESKGVVDHPEDVLVNDTPSMPTISSARERPSRSIDRERRPSLERSSRALIDSGYDVTHSQRERRSSLPRSEENERPSIRPLPPVTRASSATRARPSYPSQRDDRGSLAILQKTSLYVRIGLNFRSEEPTTIFSTPVLVDRTHEPKILGSPWTQASVSNKTPNLSLRVVIATIED